MGHLRRGALCCLACRLAPAEDPAVAGGNDVCWYSPNWFGLELTFERCCLDPGDPNHCFHDLAGLYSYDFCCFPGDAHRCDWDAVQETLGSSGDVGPDLFEGLINFPISLREFCCVFPPSDGETQHHCFGSAGQQGYNTCCFPVLERQIYDEAGDPPWLEGELRRELAPLAGRRWSSEDLENAIRAAADEAEAPRGNSLCQIRVRNGREVSTCDLDAACPKAEDRNNDCSYIRAVRDALRIIGAIRPLPDVDLVVSPSNTDHGEVSLPIFTRHRPREPRSLYVLLPMEWQLHAWQARKLLTQVERIGTNFPWDHRAKELFWRGTNSNCRPSCILDAASRQEVSWASCLEKIDCEFAWTLPTLHGFPRGRLLLLALLTEGIDAGLTGLSQYMHPSLVQYLDDNGLIRDAVDPLDQARWSYALNIDGTGNGDRVYWQMLAGSLVVVADSPWVSWLVGEVGSNASALQPFVHYIPVRYDLADLATRLAWLREHDDEARRIAESGRRFAKAHLGLDGILLYLDRLVRRYAADHFTLDASAHAGEIERIRVQAS